jgi:hypothetical protein
MKTLNIVGFAVVLGVLVWVGVNQQRTNRDLRVLLAEHQRLAQSIANRPDSARAQAHPVNQGNTIANTQPPSTSRLLSANENPDISYQVVRPSGLVPGSRLDTGNDVRGNDPSTLLSSHSPDGKLLTRSWGPEQVVGVPNTMQAGDQTTAWAQYTSQGGAGEWLHVTFEKSVDIAEVIVRETYNPGAISKVTALLPNGQETIIWEGTEPSVQAPVDMSFPTTQKVEANSVKICLDRRRVPGWNEIDAVELVGRDGTRQWAKSADVSSAYSISPGNTVSVPQQTFIEFETVPASPVENRDTLRR